MERAVIIPEGAWQSHNENLFPADGWEGFLAGLAGFSYHDDQAETELHQWLRQEGQPVLISVVQARDHSPKSRIWVDGQAYCSTTRIEAQVLAPVAQVKAGVLFSRRFQARSQQRQDFFLGVHRPSLK